MSTPEYIKRVLIKAYPERKYIVPCFVAKPGCGKTVGVELARQELERIYNRKIHMHTLIASCAVPSEICGMTMPNHEDHTIDIYDPRALVDLKDGDILFLDELLEADQAILKACLTLIESRLLMSGRKLADIMIVAATNSTQKPNMIPSNIKERFIWFNVNESDNIAMTFLRERYDTELKFSEFKSNIEQYNQMSKRTYTKLLDWFSNVDTPEEVYDLLQEGAQYIASQYMIIQFVKHLENSKFKELKDVCQKFTLDNIDDIQTKDALLEWLKENPEINKQIIKYLQEHQEEGKANA